MAELDTIVIHNPTDEDFTQGYNGEPYTILAGESKAFAKHVANHIAKHLSNKMIDAGFTKKQRKEKPVLISQSMVYDGPGRRIALFKILQDEDLVKHAIGAYPYKGFIGNMSDYEKFVEDWKAEQAPKKAEPAEAPVDAKAEPKSKT